MASLKDLDTEGYTYKCKGCGSIFRACLIIKKPCVENSIFIKSSFVRPKLFLDKYGFIKWRYGTYEEDDYTLHCPRCDKMHFDGFDIASFSGGYDCNKCKSRKCNSCKVIKNIEK